MTIPVFKYSNNNSAWESVVRRSPVDILNNLEDKKWLSICAPMVRYSKLPFRLLLQHYNVDVTYTPMILADVFKNSEICRQIDFQTAYNDIPTVVQFGAHNAVDLADSAELVAKYCNGVDINCGCPQKWAISEGIGCHLMEEIDLVQDMIRQVKSRTAPLNFKSESGSGFPTAVKIRLHHNDLERTVDFAKKAEAAGADWITVHGRTRRQRSSEPVDLDGIKLIKENVSIPVFANGDVFSLDDANDTISYTGCDGVMSARGLLENPALFTGVKSTPLDCVERFVRYSLGIGGTHFIFHHHLMYMLGDQMTKAEKKHFNVLPTIPAILDYLEEHYGMSFDNDKLEE